MYTLIIGREQKGELVWKNWEPEEINEQHAMNNITAAPASF